MFVTNHVLAGASIGAAVARRSPGGWRGPALAFAAGFASHLVMDTFPHWGLVKVPGWREEFLRMAYRDGGAGLAAMGLAAALAGAEARTVVLAGMVGAALPDLDKPFEEFLGVCPFPRWFQDFHVRIQNEAPDRLRGELVAGGGLAALAARSLAGTRAPLRAGGAPERAVGGA